MTILKKLMIDLLFANSDVMMENAIELRDEDKEASALCLKLANEFLDEAQELIEEERVKEHTSVVKVRKIRKEVK